MHNIWIVWRLGRGCLAGVNRFAQSLVKVEGRGKSGGREPGAVLGATGAPGQAPPEARQTGEIYVITSAKDRDDRW